MKRRIYTGENSELMPKKIQVSISGIIYGFAQEGETDEQSQARVVFEAEQRVNAVGDVRAHLHVSAEEMTQE